MTAMQRDTIVDRYPEDGWLRGYFYLGGNDKVGAVAGNRAWKNTDLLRLKDAALHLLSPGPGKRILDIGYAQGAMMVYCGLQGAEVFGVDLSEGRVAQANAYLRRFNLQGEALCRDARDTGFPDNYFDGVMSIDFFEHITDDVKVQVLSEIRRVLKPGSPMVLKTPNLRYLRLSLAFKWMRAVLRLQNPFKYVIPHTPGTDDPQHIGLATRSTLSACLVRGGFVNYHYYFPPLRRFGHRASMEVLSSEIPVLRDYLTEDLLCVAFKPITLSWFPD